MALPLEDNEPLLDDFELPDGYQDALAYLKGVRNESQLTPHLFISKTH